VQEAVLQLFHLPNPENSGEASAEPELFKLLFFQTAMQVALLSLVCT
jgi:hypothetical protein